MKKASSMYSGRPPWAITRGKSGKSMATSSSSIASGVKSIARIHPTVREEPLGIRLGVLRGECVRGIVEPHHVGTRVIDEPHAPYAGSIHHVEERAWIVHEGQQEFPMGFLSL